MLPAVLGCLGVLVVWGLIISSLQTLGVQREQATWLPVVVVVGIGLVAVGTRRVLDQRHPERVSERQARAEAVAAEQAAAARLNVIRLQSAVPAGAESFVCPSCGGLRDFADAVQARDQAVTSKLGAPPPYWDGLAPVGTRLVQPLVPADLQLRGQTFEEATSNLELAHRLGLITPVRPVGYQPTKLQCAQCFTSLMAQMTAPRDVPRREQVPAQLRFEVFKRDAFRCRYCGREAAQGIALHADHVVPVSAGGSTDLGNLLTACQDCNLGKTARPVV